MLDAVAAMIEAGIASSVPSDQHHLAPVAVAQRAEVQHRGGEPQREADRDQVERGLRGVEGLADVGQGDVGDRQVEVRDGRDQDQREQDQPGAPGSARGRLGPACAGVRAAAAYLVAHRCHATALILDGLRAACIIRAARAAFEGRLLDHLTPLAAHYKGGST